MFTGIVTGKARIEKIVDAQETKRLSVFFNENEILNLQRGASIAIDGVCLTVVNIDGNVVDFDVIKESLERTTLKYLQTGELVNFERAAKIGDEIGGHLISGHVYDTATVQKIEKKGRNTVMSFQVKHEWIKYFFPKGFIAIDGISLTLVDVNADATFTVHLIPETLCTTTLGNKHCGSLVNIEIDAQIQAIVDTIERIDGRSALYQRQA